MDIRFSVTKMPFDYQMNHPDVPQVVSVGMYSYAGNELIHFGGEKDSRLFCNVLIGRFCSLADDITFFIGLNHVYKNVVTTYPFDDRGIAIDFSAWNRPYERHLIPNLRQTRDNHYQVIIGNDVWIGNGATIIGGVKIGSGAIIGTNSVVAKDIPPYAIAVGNPARVVKFRFDADTISKFLAIKWWNWDIKKILDNVPQMYCIEKFLSAHYTPGMELAPYAEIGGGERNWSVILQKDEKFIRSWQIFAQYNRSGKELSAAFSNHRKRIPYYFSGWAKAQRQQILKILKLSLIQSGCRKAKLFTSCRRNFRRTCCETLRIS